MRGYIKHFYDAIAHVLILQSKLLGAFIAKHDIMPKTQYLKDRYESPS